MKIDDKKIQETAKEVKEVIDPIYLDLCSVSRKFNESGVGVIEITTPDGVFVWHPYFDSVKKTAAN